MNSRMVWTDELDEVLRRDYPHMKTQDLADRMGLRKLQVYVRAQTLGLRKSEAFLAGPNSGRLDGTTGTGARFKPGQTSWNKGMHYMPKFTTTKHLFVKGQQAKNKRPIGAHRVHAGYAQIKVGDTGYTPDDWEFVHRIVWEKANGPIPPGHVVRFKPGTFTLDPEKITPDILMCTTRRELFQQNSIAFQHPELQKIVQLRGALTRQIRKREQKENP